MSSLNLNNDGYGFSFDLNVFPLSEVPTSSSTPLLGHVDDNKSEKSEIPFDILKPLVIHPHEKPVTNTEGNGGYFGDEQKNMSLKVDEVENEIENVSSKTKKSGNNNFFIRGNWTPTEDDKLKKLVEEFGPYNWNNIAKYFNERSGKSCRLRWRNQLHPKLNRSSFNEEEEAKLLVAQKFYGNKWTTICKLFHGRTDNAVRESDLDRNTKFFKSIRFRLRRLGSCLLGERKVEGEDFSYDNNFSAMKGSYVRQMGMLKSFDQFNYSNLNLKASVSESVPTIRHNVSILGQSENVRDMIKVPFIDFLGVGDT
ncbi:transcription factor MYB52 [Trifolium repens]|nr:transcription factor MYB52 [Trifolium repens]